MTTYSRFVFETFLMYWSIYNRSFVSLVTLRHPFRSSEKKNPEAFKRIIVLFSYLCYYYYYYYESFSHQLLLMVFHWSLSDSKSPQVCRIIIIIIIIIVSFSYHRKLMVFHWSLSDSKSPQATRTLLSILSVLNNAVVWIVSSQPPNSKSSSPFNNHLVTKSTNHNWYNCHLHVP